MTDLLKDIRYGFRLLFKSPGFTTVAVLSLALAIGANTTIFTVINAFFLTPLPVQDIGELVNVSGLDQNNQVVNLNLTPLSWQNFEDYKKQNEVFSGLTGFVGMGLTLTGYGDPQNVPGQLVSSNYFDVLGVKATMGRMFGPNEDQGVGTHPVVVLSHGVWTRVFNSDPGIINRVITLNNQPFTVIGVAARNFKGTFTLGNPDLIWVPSSMYQQVLSGTLLEFFTSRRALFVNAVARLKPGVSIQQAEAAMKTIAFRLAAEYPKENEGRSIKLLPLAQAALGANQRAQFRTAGSVLMTIVGLVLLIACVNLANLLLARAGVREREVGIRTALGAGRNRLIRQLLTESVILSLCGGVAGLLIAYWGRNLLWSLRPPFLNANAVTLSLDQRVLAFTAGISVFTGLLFGLIPALKVSSPNLNESLKLGGRYGTPSWKRTNARAILVVVEITLALIALVGAGLFVQSMRRAQSIDLGFETEKLFVMAVNLGAQNMEQGRGEQFYANAIARAKSSSGVANAAVVSNLPLGGGFLRSVFKEGQEQKPGQRNLLTLTNIVSPEYFDTVRIPILHGRLFSEFDRAGTTNVVVVNEAMTRKFWPGEEAIGKRFTFFGQTQLREIVGIVRNATVFQVGEDPQAAIYMPLAQNFTPAVTIQVRTTGSPESAMETVRKQIQALEPNLPLTNIATMKQQLDQALFAPRMGAALLGLFGVLALALAGIGIYGVMAYSVTQRTQEIGIRMALGAARGEIVRMVLKQGMILASIGLGVGLLASAALTRLVSSLLFGVSATDPVVFGTVSLILAAAAFVACYVPARRATRVDPLVALRIE
jgi:predicted permease